MALRIIKASEPIKINAITTCLYSQPGIGKSTLAFTAASPLLLDFDNGSYRAGNRKDVVRPTRWSDVTEITADDLAAYSTIIVDTAGRALDMLSADIIGRNPKMGRGGALSQQGYGQLKSEFTGWLKSLRAIGKDVVLIAHMDEQRSGDEVMERLDIQGSSKNEIYKSADAMGRLRIIDGKRVLDFNPSGTGFGKNPAQLAVMEVPNFAVAPDFLGTVISQIKDALNSMSEAQIAAMKEQDDLRVEASEFDTPEQFTKKADELHGASDILKRMLVQLAKDKGFAFDKAKKAFVAKAAA